MKYEVATSYPIITSYPPYAAQLALTDEYIKTPFREDYLNWFIQQYTNIVLYTSEHYDGMILFDDVFHTNMLQDLLNNDLLCSEFYNGVLMHRENIRFSSLAIDQLRRGYAIYLYLNFRFFPYINYQNDYNHEVLITGYDDQTDSFTVYGFYCGKKYAYTIVPCEQLDKSFSTFVQFNNEQNKEDNCATIRCYKRKNEITVPLDRQAFHFLVERWLNGEMIGDLAYGKLCFSILIDWLSSDPQKIDWRSLHLLYDHANGLRRTCNCLQARGLEFPSDYFEDIDTVIQESMIVRNLQLKDRMVGENRSRILMRRKIELILDLEEKLFHKIEDEIRKKWL